MDLSDKSESEFLTDIANRCGFEGDEREVFLQRFVKDSTLQHKQVMGALWKYKEYSEKYGNDKARATKNRREKFRNTLDTKVLNKLYKVFKDEGCPPIKKKDPPIKKNEKLGRYPKGKSPWEQMHKWLWNIKFHKWQVEQKRMGEDAALDVWHDRCRKLFNNHQQLTSNRLNNGYEDAILQRQQIYVHLALARRTKRDKHSSESSSAAKLSLYKGQHEEKNHFEHKRQHEEKNYFEHDAFLTQILERGEGKTKGQRIALIGKPGAGKTTLLQHIYSWKLGEIELPRQQETKNVVIWISLADLRGQSIGDHLLKTVLPQALEEPHTTPEDESELVDLFKSRRVWLLLDGLDEMASGNPRKELKSQLTSWVASAHVVLTCRQNIWHEDGNLLTEEFEAYDLLDFDYPLQVNKFIDKWFCDSDPKVGKQLKAELGTAEQWLRNFVQNPLMLWLLCFIWLSREGKLPQTRFEFYHQIVKKVYNWDISRFESSKQEELDKALKRLAKWDIGEGDSRFWLRESKITDHLGLPNDKGSLFHLALNLGLLNNVAQKYNTGENVYTFFHPTFEEYFAAWEIDDWHFFLKHIPNNRNHPDASYRIFEPKWEEVILLWLGREDVEKEHKEEFIQALVEFDDGCGDFYHYRAYFLAAKGIAEFNFSRADEIIERMVRLILSRRFVIQEELWEAFAVFPKTERTRAINGLTRIIDQSQFEYIQLHAAGNLGRIDKGNSTAIYTLVALIQNSQDKFNPGQAARILGEIVKGNSTAIDTAIDALLEALVDLIQNSPQSSNIWGIAGALEEIAEGNLKAIKELKLLIDRFESDDINFHVASILGRIDEGNSKAIHTLVRLIREYPNGYTPQNAANTLYKIAKGNSIAISALVELVMLIEEFRNEYTSWNIVKILCEIPNDDSIAISALVILIQWFLSEEILRLVMMILGEIATKDNSEVINALVQFLHDSQPEKTRWQAVSALGKINPDNPKVSDASVELIQNLQSKDTREQVECNLWLIDLNHPKIIEALINLVQLPQSKSIHGQVALGLTKIDSGNPKVIEILECLIQNSQQTHVIAVAGRVIKRINPINPKVIEILESLTQNSHQPEDVRLQAAETLQEINPGNPRVIETSSSLAQNSQDEEILLSTAKCLVETGAEDSTTIATLKSLVLNSQDIATYQQAAGTLKFLRKDLIEEVIPDFKDYLSVEANENDYQRYGSDMEVVVRQNPCPISILYNIS
ncbi:NACHT domain-containing protein [Chroococcidiopsis sp. FACHB-1243]|uniref:NACHT domain-containing protein n=1 Tax=Chroococcidiopsis sp. [FACHB-1243] TaxID=2692781 RepID=UPI0017874B8C|nr:NACHT domain-containing protein [Chroococcidiopsis sp. [FACHB-1243]]MBD2309527.1 NACHT domain-containing protein [Chroococcidiopsis sp. [FACHB-1243]]